MDSVVLATFSWECGQPWRVVNTLHWRKVLFSFLGGINYNNFLVRYKSLCPLPHN